MLVHGREDADAARLAAVLGPALHLFGARFPGWWLPLPPPPPHGRAATYPYPLLVPSESVVAADARVALVTAAAAPLPAAAAAAATSHLLAARGIRTGYKGFLGAAGRDLAARKARLALVVLALEHDEVHSAEGLAGNEYAQGPFYQYRPRTAL